MECRLFLDTNALINLGESAFNERFIISQKTLEEIENIKTSHNKDGEVKYKCRIMARLLDENYGNYDVIKYDKETLKTISDFGLQETPDNIILADAYLANCHSPIVFCTDDLNCRFLGK